MTKETMTVHQALCELKVLEKRIDKAIEMTQPLATKECSSQKVAQMPVADFIELAKGQHQTAMDLISRQCALKAAVNQYNAEKIINVGGKEYSVAQAIWMMKYGVAKKKQLMERYSKLLNLANRGMEMENNDRLNARAEAAMNAIYGNREKAQSEEYLKGIEDYKKAHALEMIDPLGIRNVIQELENDISSFETNVDAAIQVANATTEIVVEY